MTMVPKSDETSLVGSWTTKNGSAVQDGTCERIQWLIDHYLEQLIVDGENWLVLYMNPHDGEYWELSYPQSHMHGGGPPKLTRISKQIAETRYKGRLKPND